MVFQDLGSHSAETTAESDFNEATGGKLPEDKAARIPSDSIGELLQEVGLGGPPAQLEVCIQTIVAGTTGEKEH